MGAGGLRATPATRDDESRMTTVLRDAFETLVPGLGYRPGPMDRDYSPLLDQCFILKLTAPEDSPQAIGFAVTLPRASHLYLEAIAIDPARQGRGYGGVLLSAVEALASDICLPRIRLHTDPALDRPMRFYRNRGYRELGRQGFGSGRRALFEKRAPTRLELLVGQVIEE